MENANLRSALACLFKAAPTAAATALPASFALACYQMEDKVYQNEHEEYGDEYCYYRVEENDFPSIIATLFYIGLFSVIAKRAGQFYRLLRQSV